MLNVFYYFIFQYKFPEQTKKEIIKTLNFYHGLVYNFETFCKLFLLFAYNKNNFSEKKLILNIK